jgi:hypothetical protein
VPYRVMYVSVDGAGFEKEPRTTPSGKCAQALVWDPPREWATRNEAQAFADEQQASVANDNPWCYRWKVLPTELHRLAGSSLPGRQGHKNIKDAFGNPLSDRDYVQSLATGQLYQVVDATSQAMVIPNAGIQPVFSVYTTEHMQKRNRTDFEFLPHDDGVSWIF